MQILSVLCLGVPGVWVTHLLGLLALDEPCFGCVMYLGVPLFVYVFFGQIFTVFAMMLNYVSYFSNKYLMYSINILKDKINLNIISNVVTDHH
jgi:hypothetical protein